MDVLLRPALLLGALALASAPPPPPAGDATRRLRRDALERALQAVERELLAGQDLHEVHATWEDPWVVRSRSYEVRTTQSWYLANKLGRDLDLMLDEFRGLLGLESWSPGQPLPVWILPTIEQYNAFGQNADEHSSFYGSFYAAGDPAAPVAAVFDPNATRLGMTVTHSAFHQFESRATSAQVPLWVSEGLASYFSLFWDWSWATLRFRALAKSPGWIPLSRLLRASRSDYLPNAEDEFLELGMLVRYLLHHHEETRVATAEGETVPAPFREYLRALYGGGDASETAFARRFADLPAGFEEAFRSFDFGG